jgi:hypothetical protein
MSLDLEAGLDWRAKVELFEQSGVSTSLGRARLSGLPASLGAHRRMVRDAVRSATPARRKKTERPQVKMAVVSGFIDEILESDRKAPRKQRHTAKRIWERTREEIPGSTVAERTVRQYVERRKRELGHGRRDSFVPQSYEWGVEAQVDWYEAFADLEGERTRAGVLDALDAKNRFERKILYAELTDLNTGFDSDLIGHFSPAEFLS